MRRNKVSFPRAKPAPGMAYFTMAYKTESGLRVEFDGQVLKDLAEHLMHEACKGVGAPSLAGIDVEKAKA